MKRYLARPLLKGNVYNLELVHPQLSTGFIIGEQIPGEVICKHLEWKSLFEVIQYVEEHDETMELDNDFMKIQAEWNSEARARLNLYISDLEYEIQGVKHYNEALKQDILKKERAIHTLSTRIKELEAQLEGE